MTSQLMPLTEAIRVLREGGTWPALAEAIGVTASSSQSDLFDIALGLNHRGMVAEQAALALYKRMNIPLPEDRTQVSLDHDEWMLRIYFHEKIGSGKHHRPLKELLESELSREERLVLILYYYEGANFPTIAVALDLSEKKVRTIYDDAIARLRESLAHETKPLSRLLLDLAKDTAA